MNLEEAVLHSGDLIIIIYFFKHLVDFMHPPPCTSLLLLLGQRWELPSITQQVFKGEAGPVRLPPEIGERPDYCVLHQPHLAC